MSWIFPGGPLLLLCVGAVACDPAPAGHAQGQDASAPRDHGHGGAPSGGDASSGADAARTTDAGADVARPPSPQLPGELLDLASWKLTLPEGHPTEIAQPELATYAHDELFFVDPAERAVVFRAPCGGATTSGSSYPRAELREMTAGGADEASWSTASGTHELIVRAAITHLPLAKPHVVAAQIHDASDDVLMIRLEGSKLFIELAGEDGPVLDDAYALGTPFTVRLEATGGKIRVWYDGVQKLELEKDVSGCYFKAGCYTQSNTSKGDAPDAYGEVKIYGLGVKHG